MKIGVLDFETDPFKYGRVPYPFACCVYFGENDYALRWEPSIIEQTLELLRQLPKCTIYAHNGGRFDFHFLVEYAEKNSPIIIRNGRIIQMDLGKCTLKDSWPLMPFALEEYKKTKIDYLIFEQRRRNAPHNRSRIEKYLVDDCRYLRELLLGFQNVIGEKDTIGSAAFEQMRLSRLNIISTNEQHDAMFREFYFGGRVEAFQKGEFNGPFQYLDINSAYPYAMLFNHASGTDYYHHGAKLPCPSILQTSFVRCIANSNKALPLRDDSGGLSFPAIYNAEFYATGWEILAGLETKTLEIVKVIDIWMPRNFINFRDYVKKFYALRSMAKINGDAVQRLAYKYLLNSGYGKFAQNPREFKRYKIRPYGKNGPKGYDWECDYGAISFWQQSSYNGWGFYDVATGASITGFVRAYWWRAACHAKGLLYGDTDQMICKSADVPRGEKLGQWKLEGICEKVIIAGKKLYGVKWEMPVNGEKYKITSKGARLTWSELRSIARGEVIEWRNAAPTFSLSGAHFIHRNIRGT